MKIAEFKNVGKTLLFFLGTIVTVYIAVLAVSYFTYTVMNKVKRTDIVYIPTGTTLSEQAAILVEKEFLKDTTEYLNFARKMDYTTVHPGKFSLKEGMSYRDLFHIIGKGRQTPVRLIFNNIDDAEELAAKLSTQIELDSLAIINMLANDTLVAKFGTTPKTSLYIFIPNTYEVYWNITEEMLLSLIKKEYDKFWGKEERKTKLEEINLTCEEVTTLASIVEKECRYEKEMPIVAGVYINRLNKKMLLQADPTVKFALGDKTLRRIMHKHLTVDSPYNTYIHLGLPPTPICIPSIAAVDAVLNYEKNDYLYFCASEKMDMTHRFATSLTEHNKNARKYAKALNNAGILN